MTARELIGKLQALIKVHGDLPVSSAWADDGVRKIHVLDKYGVAQDSYGKDHDFVPADFYLAG